MQCVMDDATFLRKFLQRTMLWAAVLVLSGCSLTAPPAQPPILPSPTQHHGTPFLRDPFLEATAAKIPSAKTTSPKTVLPEKTEAVAENLVAVPPEPVTESPSEQEESYRAGVAEQEAILSKDAWLRNVVLDRWIDNDMQDPFPGSASAASRQRAESMDLLNLSLKDREKRRMQQSAQYVTGLFSTWRWFHRDMEQLAGVPIDERISPEIFLTAPKYADKKYRLLRANAAILLGRDGDPVVVDELIHIVTSKDFRTPLRCAAAETLGKLKNVSAEQLIALTEPFKETESEVYNPQTDRTSKISEAGIPELWQELLYAAAEKIEPWEHPCFTEPLYARTYETRLAVARLWRIRSQNRNKNNVTNDEAELPPAFLDNAGRETSEMIRYEIIRTLGYWQVPDLLRRVNVDLNHTANLRKAALDALTTANCREAIPVIKQRLRDIEPGNRVQAVAALRKFGELDEVFRMANDADVKVRIEVARALAQRQTVTSLALAKKFMAENNERLQNATLDAVTKWPLPQRGEILLAAAQSPVPGIRRRAVDALQNLGVDTGFFDVTRPPATQKSQQERLAAAFQAFIRDFDGSFSGEEIGDELLGQKISPNDPMLEEVRRSLEEWRKPALSQEERQATRDRLTALGDRLILYTNYLYEVELRTIPASLDSVLAEVDPLFAAIVLLDSDDLSERRKGVAEIRRHCSINTPTPLAVQRLLARTLQQDDALILASLLDTLKIADADAARTLATHLLDAEEAALRRQGCDVLAECNNIDDLRLFIDMLYDPNRDVLRSALLAVVAMLDVFDDNGLQEERAEIDRILQTRLLQEDVAVQLDVAAALHRLGSVHGTEALHRLAASSEPGTKIAVAKTMSASEDACFVPVLIRYLDDRNGSVRKAALDGLPRLAEKDFGGGDEQVFATEKSPTQQRTSNWKKWYENRQHPY